MTAIGVGSHGITLAITLIRNGHEAVLWGHNLGHITTFERNRCNAAFLPDMPFPDMPHLKSDPATALAASRDILVIVPSHVFSEVLYQIKPLMRLNTRLVWVTKGPKAETERLLQDVAHEALGDQVPPAVILGPALAKELAAGLPITISLVSVDQTSADNFQQLLYCGRSFRVYSNPDFISVQLGGTAKNVAAIGMEVSDGTGFGVNTRTALITRRLVEMSRLGAALGADPVTLMGMAGLGDLVFTCTDSRSCNRRFGMILDQGMDAQSVQEKIGQVMEGYYNTKEVRELAHRFGAEMPIIEEIYQVSYCGKNAREAVLISLGCARKDEHSSH